MIETLITLIAVLIILGLLWWALERTLALLPIDSRIRAVISILAILFVALVIADYFGLLRR